jgi:hypothetical protein
MSFKKKAPKTETLTRIDPDEDFSDVDGDPRTEFALVNEDPTRHYHWAHKSPDDIGQYKGGVIPYRVEHATADGVAAKMAAEFVEGETIMKRDHVLVSCDKEKWDKLQRYRRKQTTEANESMFKKSQRSVTAGMRE